MVAGLKAKMNYVIKFGKFVWTLFHTLKVFDNIGNYMNIQKICLHKKLLGNKQWGAFDCIKTL